MIYLDTNAAMALSKAETKRFSRDAHRLLEREMDIRISPMVLVELEILREIGRVQGEANLLFARLRDHMGLRICDLPFEAVAKQAVNEGWTRDPFDRVIVAQARLNKAPLITRDTAMHAHYAKALS